ncbi:MAG: class I SAM-dependent methyltransferase [Elusimicrobia bacterium]|nr:class I SAM-dependent methyltransferase [Elusimicrobiota bacterium]
MLQESPCPLCGSREEKKLHEDVGERFDARLTTDVYGGYGRIVRCRRCTLAYRNPKESVEEIESAYRSAEDPEAMVEGECRSINAFLSLRVIREHVPGGRLLEVGSSLGTFLNAARPFFDAIGLEPSRWAARLARERFQVQVIEDVLRPGLFGPSTFDVVVAIDVVEHVPDPQAALSCLASFLRPGGILYLVTPNISSLSARLLGRWWWGFRPAHLTYFSPVTLGRLLSNVGLEVRQCRSYGRVFSYGYWLSRLKNYPSGIVWLISSVLSFLGWSGKVLYLDTRDSMEVIAVKRQ